MVFTCLFTRRGMALDDGDAFRARGPAGPSRCARAVAPPSDRSRSSGGCARQPPVSEASVTSRRWHVARRHRRDTLN